MSIRTFLIRLAICTAINLVLIIMALACVSWADPFAGWTPIG